MGVYLLIAARNLLQARRRTALLSTALGMVSMLLVLLLTLSQGISDTMIHASTLLTSGHVNVAGFFKTKPTSYAPLVTHYEELRKIIEENTPGLDYVIDRSRGWARVISERQSIQAGLVGVDARQEQRFMEQLELAEERDYKEGGAAKVTGSLEHLGDKDMVVLFVAQAKRLGVGVGDSITITAETPGGQTNTADGKIIAVAKDVGFLSNFNVFVDKKLIENLYLIGPDTTGNIMVYLKDPSTADRTMGHLRDVLSSKGFALMDHQAQPFFFKFEIVGGEDWTGQKLDLTTWEDEMGFMKWSLNALNSISAFLVGVLLLMIIVGIMNSMWIAVRERTQEIGTLRAIGMGRRRILLMFLVEAFLLGLAATTLGSLVGAAVAGAINAMSLHVSIEAVRMILMSDTLHLSLRLSQILSSVAVFTVVTALAALWPAMRAARLQPVTAIHRLG